MSATDYTGSWFSTGFFGHHRSRWRNDFVNHYRQMARPQPPDVFLKRLHDFRTKSANPFSEHDTRQSRDYINLSFELPVNEKLRDARSARHVNRDIIAWTRGEDGQMKRKSSEAATDANVNVNAKASEDESEKKSRLTSSYTATYNRTPPKQITCHPVSYYEDRPWTSSYRNAYCAKLPTLDVMGNCMLLHSAPVPVPAPSRPRMQRSESSTDVSMATSSNAPGSPKLDRRETVSSCLVWHGSASRSPLSREQVKSNSLAAVAQNDEA